MQSLEKKNLNRVGVLQGDEARGWPAVIRRPKASAIPKARRGLAYPLHSRLAVLGIAIGAAAVVVVMAIGAGARAELREQMQRLGTNVLVIVSGSTRREGLRQGLGSRLTLTEDDAAASFARPEKGTPRCGQSTWIDIHKNHVYARAMEGGDATMRRRINVSLPQETVSLLDRVAPKGDRSQLIAEAVRFYVAHAGRAQLRKRLKEGALRRAERDRGMAEEWFFLDENLWQRRGR